MSLSRALLLPSPRRIRSAFGQLAAALAVVALASGTASAAQSTTYSFNNVTTNAVANVETGEAQLSVTASEVVGFPDRVAFTFNNSGPNASSITDIYFDDGSLLGIASITATSGSVNFSVGATPGNLPSGENIDFHASGSSFTADSNPPVQPNGVNPGESVTITFNLVNGKLYADTIAALNLSLAHPGVDVTDGLRIGIHVQGFANGGSESFVNVNAVPEPASLATAGLGVLMGLGYAWRRKRASA